MNHFNLDKQPKISSGHKVPDNYFEDFSENIMKRIQEKDSKVIAINKPKKWVFAIAAILIVSLGLFSIYRISENRKLVDQNILENYIADYSTVSNDDLISLLDETDIREINVNSDISDADIEELMIQNSNLEQYLIN